MINDIGNIFELEDGRKFGVMQQAVYKGINYYHVVRVNEEEDDIIEEYDIFQQVMVDGEEFLQVVTDVELKYSLAKIFEKAVKEE